MIRDIKSLTKVAEILFSEGPILTLYKHESQFLLCSFLKENLGTVYYSVTTENLKSYLNSKITLREVYLQSEDFIVSRQFQKGSSSHLNQDFAELLQFGDKFYSEIDISMRNDNIHKLIL